MQSWLDVGLEKRSADWQLQARGLRDLSLECDEGHRVQNAAETAGSIGHHLVSLSFLSSDARHDSAQVAEDSPCWSGVFNLKASAKESGLCSMRRVFVGKAGYTVVSGSE